MKIEEEREEFETSEEPNEINSIDDEEENLDSNDEEPIDTEILEESLSDENLELENEEISEISEEINDEIPEMGEIPDEEDINEEESAESLEELQQSADLDEYSRKKNIVEGALFVAGRPVSIEEIHVKSDLGKIQIKELLDELAMDYLMRPTALEIVQIQDKYSLQIKPEYTPKLKKFARGGLIPDAILKTLTIIALKQPLLKSKLVKIRGSTSYEHVKYLIENGYIDAMKKGRSHELTSTDLFSDTFGLSRDVNEMKKQLIIQLGVKGDSKES